MENLDELESLRTENAELRATLQTSGEIYINRCNEIERLQKELTISMLNEQLNRKRLSLAEAVCLAAEEHMPIARACIARPREFLLKLHVALKAWRAAEEKQE